MKKIWLWLLLLLLLIIFCVWTKKDNIHLTSSNTSSAAKSTIIAAKQAYIDYSIIQTDANYELHGNFTNTQQQSALGDTCTASSTNLLIKDTQINDALVGNEALTLTQDILPHFIKHYKNGKIVYSDNKLSVYGDVSNYEVQNEMRRRLSNSTLSTQDHTQVLLVKPIDFRITKIHQSVTFSGTVANQGQITALQNKLPSNSLVQVPQEPHREDKGAVVASSKILPAFIAKYTRGTLEYRDAQLYLNGMVKSQSDLDDISSLVSSLDVPVTNDTTLDPEALSKIKAAAAAKEAQRVAEEAKKTQRENDLASQKEAQLATQTLAKENIAKLFKIETIEFNVGKSSLTAKGEGTVDKLAVILKKYSSIHIEIAGHTDSDGSAEFNQKLSQSRVDTVKARLEERNIHTERLKAIGYGESKPLVPNTSSTNKQKNRRVEINIQGK